MAAMPALAVKGKKNVLNAAFGHAVLDTLLTAAPFGRVWNGIARAAVNSTLNTIFCSLPHSQRQWLMLTVPHRSEVRMTQ